MLKTQYILFFLLIHSLSYTQILDRDNSNYKSFHFQNGNISSEGYLINGKPNGYWITYHSNGLIKSEGNRKNFELDSLWSFYNDVGNLNKVIDYREGLKNGINKIYEDCYLKQILYFKNNIKDSISIEFYLDSNEIVKKLTPFKEGREEGLEYEYSRDGRIITITEYKKGFVVAKEKINRKDKNDLKTGIWKDFYKNNKVKEEKRFKEDKLKGYYKYYGSDGHLDSANLYIMGVKQIDEKNSADFEILTDYYSSGNIKETSVYNSAGNKNGVNQFYNKDGIIDSSKVFNNGNLLSKGLIDEAGYYQGYWEYYYLSGELKSKGNYKDGKKFGEWVYYFKNGNIEQKGKFDLNGRFTSKWKWFFENGNILRQEEFLKGIEDGYLIEYDINGNIITEGEFLEGEKEGEWFYKLNDHEENGKYLYGERNGYWEFKHPNGKTAFKGVFLEGIPDGEHLYYNEDGVLIKKEEYSFGEKEGKWVWYDDFGIETLTISYKDNKENKINGEKTKFDKIK